MTDRAPGSSGPPAREDALALDGLAYGIDQLDAIVVFHIGDGRLHAAWVRPGGGFSAGEIADSLREAYRVCLGVSHRLAASVSYSDRPDAPALIATIEMPSRTAMIKRSRAFGIGCLFDASMPLGMARLVTMRLASTIEPELPVVSAAPEARASSVPASSAPASSAPVSFASSPSSPPSESDPLAELEMPMERIPHPEVDRDLPPRTLDFPSTGVALVPRSSSKPAPTGALGRTSNAEIDRIKRILEHLQVHAPEPHVAHLRVALRAGVTPLALDRPEALAANKMALVEAAVEEILGIDLSDLGSIA